MKAELETRKGANPALQALFRISEIYASVQGEGLLTGTPSIFVRTSGCNLRCWFCDTRHASWEPEGPHLTAAEILKRALQLEPSHIVLTGGEPMIYASLAELCDAFYSAGRHVTIETAGTLYRDVRCDLISISPKLSGSEPTEASDRWRDAHNHRRERIDVVRQLMSEHEYQLKFVVDCEADAREVLRYLERLHDVDCKRVLLMPQGTEALALAKQAEWLAPWCKQHQFQFCPRLHIEWFGNTRGT